jgi:2-keto-4-pentenoate hydratase/2-oxohepta-3-ene-1,7-dioic acid hydratase in catechol pathway
MQFVRYRHKDVVAYGLRDGEILNPLNGEPYSAYARRAPALAVADVTLLAPVVPSKIAAVGNNFADRAREAGLPAPTVPLLFLKPPSAVIGPGEAIVLPPQSQRVEHGAELAVVIGRPARWVAPEEALRCVWGYTCANDVTARDILEAEGLWTRAKSFDSFCPLGPVVDTTLDPADVLITCRVNGQTRQLTSTHDMLFSVPQLIAFVSSVMTLLPGDVILTGTPAGAGPLLPGDEVEVEIEGLPVLKNPVVVQSSAGP